jgi:UDPglucose--hexose-1-phosphate uridylyltransferase
MSQYRQDPATGDWVIMAPERASRPGDGPRVESSSAEAPARDPDCPFCPGNENQTPPETLRIPGPAGWRVRVVPNKYGAVSAPTGAPGMTQQGLLVSRDGVGFHEVIVETPDHYRQLADLESGEVAHVLRAYRSRYNALVNLEGIDLVVLFRNQGRGGGASLAHPHSQLMATAVLPPYVRQRLQRAGDHLQVGGGCLYCSLLDAEVANGQRLVLQSAHCVVLEPFAARSPYETWILPRRHAASFGDSEDPELEDLAGVLRDTLRAISRELEGPDLNYVVHSAPNARDHARSYHWHLQIVPRVTTPAGFELGTGISINTVAPEEAARRLRRHFPR